LARDGFARLAVGCGLDSRAWRSAQRRKIVALRRVDRARFPFAEKDLPMYSTRTSSRMPGIAIVAAESLSQLK